MLRKLILFAITSGLAKKAWDQYRQQRAAGGAGSATRTSGSAAPRTAPASVSTPPVGTPQAEPVSPMQYH